MKVITEAVVRTIIYIYVFINNSQVLILTSTL